MNFLRPTLIALLIVYILPARAQDKKVHLGLGTEVAFNWLNVSGDMIESEGSKVNMNYGLLADFHFGENYALATGFFINHTGGKTKSKDQIDTLVATFENNFRFQSIRIPLAIKMMTKEIGYFRYYGLFGFHNDILINASSDVKVNGGATEEDVNIKDDVPIYNASLVFGLGFMYNWTGTTNFIVGVTYSNGLINFGQHTEFANQRMFTRQIALNLGVLF